MPRSCSVNNYTKYVKVVGVQSVGVKNETAMKSYVGSTGPLSVCVDASDWSGYTGGIKTTCGTSTDHCVQLVGYASSSSYHHHHHHHHRLSLSLSLSLYMCVCYVCKIYIYIACGASRYLKAVVALDQNWLALLPNAHTASTPPSILHIQRHTHTHTHTHTCAHIPCLLSLC